MRSHVTLSVAIGFKPCDFFPFVCDTTFPSVQERRWFRCEKWVGLVVGWFSLRWVAKAFITASYVLYH